MGEQIEFPKNFNVYMSEVMGHLGEGNVEKAVGFMKKAYALKEEETLNVLLVSSLLQIGSFREALELADEKKPFYEKDEKRLLIYVEVLLENNRILQAEKYIKDQLASQTVQYKEAWIRLDESLEDRKKRQEEVKRKAEEKTVRELFSLASLNTMEQLSKISEVYSLPNDKLKSLAPQLFTNPYVHPLVRATLLSLLAERGVDEQVSYLWFGEMKTINPKDTLPLEEDPMVKRFMNLLDNELAQNPSLYQLVKNEVDTILLMLYPFESEIIEKKGVKTWLSCIIAMIEPEEYSEKSEFKDEYDSIEEWIENIHGELLRFE